MTSDDFQTHMKNAGQYLKNGQISDALVIFDELYKLDERRNNLFLCLSFVTALKKAGQHSKAVEVGLVCANSPDCWATIKQQTAWCIYFEYFKTNLPPDVSGAVLWLDKIVALYPQRAGVHPLPLAAFAVFSKYEQLNPHLIVHICRMIDPAMLDIDLQKNADGKILIGSQREKYYSHLTKALYAAELYSECFQECQGALNGSFKLSRGSDIWFRRRAALALAKMGNIAGAYSELAALCIVKPDWFILHETAALAYKLDLMDDALKFACRAALAYGDNENKIHLWELMAEICHQKKLFDQSIQFLSLSAAIYRDKAWKVPTHLNAKLSSFNISVPGIKPCTVLFQSCRKMIETLLNSADPPLTGSIKTILPHGRSGFIVAGKSTYYFKTNDCRFNHADIKPDLKVTFQVQKSFDQVKQRGSLAAVNVRKEE